MSSFRKAHKAIRMLAKGSKHKYSQEFKKAWQWWNFRRARPAFVAMAANTGAMRMAQVYGQIYMPAATKAVLIAQIAVETAQSIQEIYTRKQF
jgi:hypothetical protein